MLSKQILVSGTFIAKHVKAALYARTRDGFSSEMYVALQKGLDTELWLLLLSEGQLISEYQYRSMRNDCVEMIKLTSSISKTSPSDE